MNSIRGFEIEERHRQAFINTLQRASLVLALTLFAALPSQAYSYYSGASVGSDGTVYGWGVTDATPPPGMYHTAYVYTTLTSPKGRVANYGQVSAPSTVRQDVSLPFDPADLGTYVVASLSSGFCHTCVCWWFQNCRSGASATEPWPAYVGVKSTSTGSTQCGSSSFYARYLKVTYQVLDTTRSPIPISGMTVQESLSWTSSTCTTSDGCGQKPTAGTWTTDSTGTITQPDSIYNCSSTCVQGGSCSEDWQQTFSVDGQSVGIVNGSTTGTVNCIATSCSTSPQGTTH